ncbi:MAG TPA: hypothetical protein VL547_10975 [Dinghuibacter sp.]|uniref:hypothetical protein n=1 Tax=Dinghuibacter sp. TaxID=2024697 RepID=UPI002BEF3D08|nr:hypothetical protein [Dinghuibacter sp.]HTJ12542.1 hypothetical protein [Dinghuibacter sp.]
MNDSFERRVRDAEGRKKIFENRVKYILFFLTVFGAFLTMWDKCAHLFQTTPPDDTRKQFVDTPTTPIRNFRSRHPRATKAMSSTLAHTPRPILPQALPKDLSQAPPQGAPRVSPQSPPQTPLEILYADNTEFALLSAVGSVGAQTIKMTMVLKTSAANWQIAEEVQSIIDDEGNEYRMRSYMNGATGSNPFIQLTTEVPIKCTYTFEGVLPGIRAIKLFKFLYFGRHSSLSEVEFRDIPITWR